MEDLRGLRIDGCWSGSRSVTRVACGVMSLRSGSWVERGIVRGPQPLLSHYTVSYDQVRTSRSSPSESLGLGLIVLSLHES